jgi:hypothetical protein
MVKKSFMEFTDQTKHGNKENQAVGNRYLQAVGNRYNYKRNGNTKPSDRKQSLLNTAKLKRQIKGHGNQTLEHFLFCRNVTSELLAKVTHPATHYVAAPAAALAEHCQLKPEPL